MDARSRCFSARAVSISAPALSEARRAARRLFWRASSSSLPRSSSRWLSRTSKTSAASDEATAAARRKARSIEAGSRAESISW
ncbi:MAG: hypothetical protein DMF49_08960 [Acidobacteria bacterium]|nr:MAG: hypothetical protein DMF49_08960 [Acidobacteriota bacterium]